MGQICFSLKPRLFFDGWNRPGSEKKQVCGTNPDKFEDTPRAEQLLVEIIKLLRYEG